MSSKVDRFLLRVVFRPNLIDFLLLGPGWSFFCDGEFFFLSRDFCMVRSMSPENSCLWLAEKILSGSKTLFGSRIVQWCAEESFGH